MIKVAWSEKYCHPLPPGHRFPMEKYELVPEQLRYEETLHAENFFKPEPMEDAVLQLTHSAGYLHRLRQGLMSYKEMRAIGFPYSPSLIAREESIMFGTVQASLYALDNGIAFNMAGGTHHAGYDKGEGFCMMNDLAVAANYLLHTGKAKKILIADLDVHQGNGTAAIFRGSEKVFTFSIHGGNNYPLHKEQSHLDVPLPDKTGDSEYLQVLENVFPKLIEKVKPDFILYQSGVDVLATDKLGRMALSMAGCRERDRIVLEHAQKHGIPLTAAMGGGYSQDIRYIVEAHANLYRLAVQMYA